MDASNAWGAARRVLLHTTPKRNQEKGLELLEKILEKLGCLPKRNVMNKKEFFEIFAHIDTLIIDVTEQRITRPSNEDIQADYYSGKKGGATPHRPYGKEVVNHR